MIPYQFSIQVCRNTLFITALASITVLFFLKKIKFLWNSFPTIIYLIILINIGFKKNLSRQRWLVWRKTVLIFDDLHTCIFLPWISEGKIISHISTCKFNMEFSLLQNKVRTQSHYYIQIQLVSIETQYIWAHLNMHVFCIRCPHSWLIGLLFIFNTSLRTQIINLVIMFYYYLIWCISSHDYPGHILVLEQQRFNTTISYLYLKRVNTYT